MYLLKIFTATVVITIVTNNRMECECASEPELQPEPQQQPQPGPQPDLQPLPQPELQPLPQPELQPLPQPLPEPKPQHTGRAADGVEKPKPDEAATKPKQPAPKTPPGKVDPKKRKVEPKKGPKVKPKKGAGPPQCWTPKKKGPNGPKARNGPGGPKKQKPQPKKAPPNPKLRGIKPGNGKDKFVKPNKPSPTKQNGIEKRIVGGFVTKPQEFPYQIAVLFDGSVGCGASIINRRWILTAAHCLEDVTAEQVQIIAGEYKISKDEGTEQVIQVSEIVNHEKYDPDTIKNDIALLKLSEPLKFNKNVKPIRLAAKGRKTEKGNVIITGWGHTTEAGQFSDVLRRVSIPLVNHETCVDLYLNNADTNIGKGQLCAGRLNVGGKDACQGDSGGPMVMLEKGARGAKEYVQVGIVSFGAGCARADFPGVFTEVAAYHEWIHTHAV